MSKREFTKERVEFLGHVISKYGVETDKEKITAMGNWPILKSLKAPGISRFNLTGCYHRFVPLYGTISRLLTQLLKKGGFVWSQQLEEVFVKLKSDILSTIVLALPDFNKVFTL